MAFWLFQANPKYSRIYDALRDLESIYWLVTRYEKAIAPNDGVLIWVAGKHAGIYAIARVLHPPHFVDRPPDLDYWIMPIRAIGRIYAPVEITQKLGERSLLKTSLKHDSILRGLEVIRAPHNTNFRVSSAQWNRVQEFVQS